MKNVLKRSLALLLIVLLSGCATPASRPVPPAGGDFIWATGQFPASLDPATSLEHPRRFDIFEMLVLPDPSGRSVEPWLATDWQSISPDRWRIQLRQDVRFHDGALLSAEDVAFSISRYLNPRTRSPVAARLSSIREVTIVDSHTIDVVTKGPDPLLLKRLAEAPILPRTYLLRVGDGEFARKPVGTGAFSLSEFVPDDRIVVIARSDHYRFRPAIGRVIVRNVPQPVARLNGLRTGNADYVNDIGVDAAESLKDRFAVIAQPNGTALTFRYLPSQDGPFSDRRVRIALNYAIDKETLARFVFRDHLPILAGQLGTPGVTGFNPRLRPFPYDPIKARQLLIDAGYPAFRTSIEGRVTSPEIAELLLFVQSQLAEVGVEAHLDVYRDGTGGREIGPTGRNPAPISFLEVPSRPAMDMEYPYRWLRANDALGTRLQDVASFEIAYQASVNELDPSRREALLQRAAEVLQADPPFIYLLEAVTVHVWSRRFGTIQPRIADDILLHTVTNAAPTSDRYP